jgi:hypothetical protein
VDWLSGAVVPLLSAAMGAVVSYLAVARQTTHLLNSEREHVAETFREQRRLAAEQAAEQRRLAEESILASQRHNREAISVAAALDLLDVLFTVTEVLPLIDRVIPIQDDRRVRDAMAEIRRAHFTLGPKLTSLTVRNRVAHLYTIMVDLPEAWNRPQQRAVRMEFDTDLASYLNYIRDTVHAYLDGRPEPEERDAPTLPPGR